MRPLEEIQYESWRNDVDSAIRQFRELLVGGYTDKEIREGVINVVNNYIIDNPLPDNGDVEIPIRERGAECGHHNRVYFKEARYNRAMFTCPQCGKLGCDMNSSGKEINPYKFIVLAEEQKRHTPSGFYDEFGRLFMHENRKEMAARDGW